MSLPAPPAGISADFIELPHGIRLSCRVAGPIDAPRLMFLHGFPQAAFIWDEVLLHFAPRYRCIAPNLRGYERSSAPAEVAAYRPKHLVADIAALITATGSGPLAALVAHDWGGALAWNLAIAQPGLMQRLVMLNSPHPGTFLRDLLHNPAQQAASAYMNFLARPDAPELLAANDFARLWRFFTNMGGAQWLTPAVRERYRAVWRGDGSTEPGRGLIGPANYYAASPLRPATATDNAIARVQFDDSQLTVRVPTTVVWGEADIALPPTLLDGLDHWVPDLDLHRLSGASHWLLQDDATPVLAGIERALSR